MPSQVTRVQSDTFASLQPYFVAPSMYLTTTNKITTTNFLFLIVSNYSALKKLEMRRSRDLLYLLI